MSSIISAAKSQLKCTSTTTATGHSASSSTTQC
jgi:hypothetical protein